MPARIASGGHLTPAIASTQALLRALENPDSPEVRRELEAWQTEATELLAELIEDEETAACVVKDLIIGYSSMPPWALSSSSFARSSKPTSSSRTPSTEATNGAGGGARAAAQTSVPRLRRQQIVGDRALGTAIEARKICTRSGRSGRPPARSAPCAWGRGRAARDSRGRCGPSPRTSRLVALGAAEEVVGEAWVLVADGGGELVEEMVDEEGDVVAALAEGGTASLAVEEGRSGRCRG
jgi:hypothetical protein